MDEATGRRYEGYTFNRQKPLGNYIVNFYCKPLKPVIEVDGGYHFEKEQRLQDKERQAVVEELRLHFLRFEDEQVKKDIDSVLCKIDAFTIGFETSRRLTVPATLPAANIGAKLDSVRALNKNYGN